MKTLNTILFAIACIVLISSCKKDDEPKISKTELLAGTTSKSWIQIAGKENGSDEFSSLPTCYKDDILVFRTDKSYEWNEGATKCDPGDPQVYITGNWAFKSDETVIQLREGEARINELTATTLRITYVLDGDTYEQTFTAK